MNWILFTAALIGLLAQAVHSKDIWINNTAPTDKPDGTQTKPYNSFTQALPNILESLNSSNVTVIFSSSSVAYPLDLLPLAQNGSYGLKLTSNIGLSKENSINDTIMPSLIIKDDFLNSMSQVLDLCISWIDISVTDTQKEQENTYRYFLFDQFDSVNIALDNVRFNFSSVNEGATNGFQLFKAASGSQISIEMNNVIFNLNISAFRQELLNIDKTYKINIKMTNISVCLQDQRPEADSYNPLFAIQNSGTDQENSVMEVTNFKLTGSFQSSDSDVVQTYGLFNLRGFSTVSFLNIALFDISNISGWNSLIDAGYIQDLSIRNFNVSNCSSSGYDSFSILQMAQDGNSTSNLLVKDLVIENSFNIQIGSIWTTPKSISFEGLRIQNLTQDDLLFLNLNLKLSSPAAPFRIINSDIRDSMFQSFITIVTYNTPQAVRFQISNVSFTRNTIHKKTVFDTSEIDLALDACTFINNTYSSINFIQAKPNANTFITKTKFINEDFGNAALICAQFEPSSLAFVLQYYLVLIDSCLFQNVSSSAPLFQIESPFFIMTNSILSNATLKGTNLLSISGPFIGNVQYLRAIVTEQLLYKNYPSILWAMNHAYERVSDSKYPYFIMISNSSLAEIVLLKNGAQAPPLIYLNQGRSLSMCDLLIENNTFIDLNIALNFMEQPVDLSSLIMSNNIWIRLAADTLMNIDKTDSIIFKNNTIVGVSGSSIVRLTPANSYTNLLISRIAVSESTLTQAFFQLQASTISAAVLSSIIIYNSTLNVDTASPLYGINLYSTHQAKHVSVFLQDIIIDTLTMSNYIPDLGLKPVILSKLRLTDFLL